MKQLESQDVNEFMKFMSAGSALISHAATNSLDTFKATYSLIDPTLVYWHEHRAFKEAIKHKSVTIINHLIVEKGLNLQQECFK